MVASSVSKERRVRLPVARFEPSNTIVKKREQSTRAITRYALAPSARLSPAQLILGACFQRLSWLRQLPLADIELTCEALALREAAMMSMNGVSTNRTHESRPDTH